MNFIKDVINYAKILFINIKLKISKYNKTSVVNDSNKEEIKLSEEELSKKQEIFDKLEFGDVIWAKRYNTNELKQEMPEGHREGPFVVVMRVDNDLYALYGTTKIPTELTMFNNIQLNYYRKDDFEKDSFFQTNWLYRIKLDSFIDKRAELNKDQKELLSKKLKEIFKLKERRSDDKIISMNFLLKVGDIISYHNNLLIIDIKDNKLYCLILDKKKSYLKNGFNLKDFDELEYSRIIEVDINDEIRYVNHLDEKILLHILKKQQEHLEKIKTPQRGTVLIKDNKIYYVFGEEGNDLCAFQLWKESKNNNDRLVINKQVFYTDYKCLVKINKKDNYQIILLAIEQEIINIRDRKKSFLKEKKNNSNNSTINNKRHLNKRNLIFGRIIKLKNEKLGYYVVISREDSVVSCISINDLENNVNRIKDFDINLIESILDISNKRLENNQYKIRKLVKNKE